MGVFTGMGGKGEMQGLAVEVSFKVTRKKEYQVWAENGLTSDILAQLKEMRGTASTSPQGASKGHSP